MPYEYDSYYLWVDNSVTATQAKNFLTNTSIPLAAARFLLGEIGALDVNGKNIKCTWGTAPVVAGGKIFEIDREIMSVHGDKVYAAFSGVSKVKIFTHQEAIDWLTANSSGGI